MKLLRLTFTLSAALVIALCQAAWTATTIPYIGGAFGNGVTATNQCGYVVGSSFHAVTWAGTAASMVDLHPAGAETSVAKGCSGSKQVGYAIIGEHSQAALWSGSAGSFVNLTPANKAPANAYGISGNTQVGQVTVSEQTHAAKWSGSAGSFVDLHPSGFSDSSAQACSASDQVGYVNLVDEQKAARWTGTAASFVSLHPTGATESWLNGTTGAHQVGAIEIGAQMHAGYWSGTAASFVNLHSGSGMSEALAVSGPYQVGYSTAGGSQHAVVWMGTAASKVDLHTSLPAGYTNSSANGVFSDAGGTYIVGSAFNTNTGRVEAILWRLAGEGDFEFALNKAQVAGQNSVQGTITAAASSLPRIYTTYDNSSLVNTPPSVTLAAGATSKSFQITVTAVTSTINTTIYAKRDAITRSRPLALVPLIPTALAFTPTQVTGGQSVSCRVVINGVAGPGGRVIAILDNSPNATVPSTVTVPAGATQVIFNISTSAVTSQKTVTVTARVSAGEKTGTFKINP